jgi:hypothetical protein
MDGSEQKYKYVQGVEWIEDINTLFRNIRVLNKITVKYLAKKVVNISGTSITKFEKHNEPISLNKIIKCFDFMGYDLLVFAVKREVENEPNKEVG